VSKEQERRTQDRVDGKESVFVKIIASRDNPELAGRTFFASSGNISKGGIQLRTDFGIAVGTSAELCIGLGSQPQSYILKARVRWCAELGTSRKYGIGMEFLKSSKDFGEWWKALSKTAPKED